MISIISFVLGLFIMYLIQGNFNTEVLEYSKHSYAVGKDDGYRLGRSDVTLEDFEFEQLEAKCMFLYDHK